MTKMPLFDPTEILDSSKVDEAHLQTHTMRRFRHPRKITGPMMGARPTLAFAGKTVAFQTYVHVSALDHIPADLRSSFETAVLIAGMSKDGPNVVRFDPENKSVALLCYPGFFDFAFPSLSNSCKVQLTTKEVSRRNYRGSFNPPILHRKELLLSPDDPRRHEFSALTSELESLGLFDDPVRIGFRLQWNNLLKERGFRVVGHQLVPIGNDESSQPERDDFLPGSEVLRHLTALTRTSLSAPVQLMLRHGLADETKSVFDYGCGKGGDVRGLATLGISCSGWDPYYAPTIGQHPADVVNLGFVINVIEDPVERRAALTRAWDLTNEVLIIATMIASEGPVQGIPFADGILTSRKTFQKYYTQAELRSYIETAIGEYAIAAGPGIFFVFKDKQSEQRFQRSRQMARIRIVPSIDTLQPRIIGSARAERKRAPSVYERHRDLIDEVWRCAVELGREPELEEFHRSSEIENAIGSVHRAFRAALVHHGSDAITQGRRQRADELLVVLALEQFEKRKPYKKREQRFQRDVRSFFGSYARAIVEARSLLLSVGDPQSIERACLDAVEAGLGWLVPGKSLQLHTELVPRLPPVLRVYVGCATLLYGDIAHADLVKIHIRSGKVSFMRYNGFSELPLPELEERTKVNLRTQEMRVFSYGTEYARPLLYLKSRFINEEHARYPDQQAFDEQLGALGLLAPNGPEPAADHFFWMLRQIRRKIVAFRIEGDDSTPSLDEKCGHTFTYRQLIECGETQARLRLSNQPKSGESYTALFDLATQILDPIVEYFGSIEITYGFCSHEMARHITARIAPKLDQHAALERDAKGHLICSRGGAAVDFSVRDEDMRGVAEWIIATLPFDRLYYYGVTKPLHVSYGPMHARRAYEMTMSASGRLIPRPFRVKGDAGH